MYYNVLQILLAPVTCREHTEACIYMQKVVVSAVCELRIHLKNTKQLERVQRTFYSLGRFLLGHLHMCHVWKGGRNVYLLVIELCSCAKEHLQDHEMQTNRQSISC